LIWFLLLILLILIAFGWWRYRSAVHHNREQLALRIARAVERQAGGRTRTKIEGDRLEILLRSPQEKMDVLADQLRSHPNLLKSCFQGFKTLVLTDGVDTAEFSKSDMDTGG
jgi:hypothetical protein